MAALALEDIKWRDYDPGEVSTIFEELVGWGIEPLVHLAEVVGDALVDGDEDGKGFVLFNELELKIRKLEENVERLWHEYSENHKGVSANE
jgi:hypothetical protein